MWDNTESRRQAQEEGRPRPPPAYSCKAGKWDKVAKRKTGCTGVIWPAHGEGDGVVPAPDSPDDLAPELAESPETATEAQIAEIRSLAHSLTFTLSRLRAYAGTIGLTGIALKHMSDLAVMPQEKAAFLLENMRLRANAAQAPASDAELLGPTPKADAAFPLPKTREETEEFPF